jgi:hypothetical protein
VGGEKLMNKFKLIFISFMVIMLSFTLVGCKKEKAPEESYTVSYIVEGQTWKTITGVKKGARVSEPTEVPVSADQENVFIGWFKDEACTIKYDSNLYIVSSNTSIYAGWEKVSTTPSQIGMGSDDFSSSLVWKQRNGSTTNDYQVILYPKQGKSYVSEGQVLEGTPSFNASAFIVTYVPKTIPNGGIYKVTIKDVTNNSNIVTAENIFFGGEGTEINPFVIGATKEWESISASKTTTGTNKYYKVLANFTITTARVDMVNSVFDGILDGNNKTITHVASNCGLFYRLGTNAKVKNLEIAGEVTTGTWESIGGLVDYNSGLIENVSVVAKVTSTSGEVGKFEQLSVAGAGGVVGTNEVSGIVKNSSLISSSTTTGNVLANIAGGGIAGINKGLITDCTNKGFIGANNELHSAKSTSRYSYLGGIVGINYASVQNSRTTGQGRILSQRQLTENAGTTNTEGQGFNIASGGIAAFNAQGATITDSYFDGIRVYGDQAVGGIAGINDGTIQNSYALGTYNTTYYNGISSTETVGVLSYVGGRIEVGGIAGRSGSNSVINNCFSTINVHSFASPGYAIAPKANNSIYLISVINDPYWSKSDAGSNATKQENLSSDVLLAPDGTGNVAISNTKTNPLTDYTLTDVASLTTLGNHFYMNTVSGIRLEYEKTIVEIVYIADVYLNVDGVEKYAGEVNSATINLLETNVTVKAVTGKYFVGWATEANGTVIINTKSINYNGVKAYIVDKEVTLYAVYGDLVKATSMTVYYWTTYITADVSSVVDSQFKAYLTAQGFSNVEGITITNKTSAEKVAPFGVLVNADPTATILLGVGANIYTTGKVAYLERIEGILMKTNADLNQARLVCRLENTDLAVAFMEFLATDAGSAAMLGNTLN